MGKSKKPHTPVFDILEQEDVCWFCENPEDCRNCQVAKLFAEDHKKNKTREFGHNMHRMHEVEM